LVWRIWWGPSSRGYGCVADVVRELRYGIINKAGNRGYSLVSSMLGIAVLYSYGLIYMR
jgi:hypothetical protein